MPISLREVRRRLPVGTEFEVEFIGRNRKICKAGSEKTRRRVIKQSTHEMTSVFLSGPDVGEEIDLNWSYCRAEERDGSIYLTMIEVLPNEEFLKITLLPPSHTQEEKQDEIDPATLLGPASSVLHHPRHRRRGVRKR